MREIKVSIYAHENDSYVELYKVLKGETKHKYIARHTYRNGNGGEWYFVSDPLGYCELDYGCPEDYVFIVCDQKGKELFRDSNGTVRHPFPTLEGQAVMSWNEIKTSYPSKNEGLSNWLLSYLTTEIMETKLKDKNCIETNWPHWCNETSREVIKRFSHLGENYCIYKITYRHQFCDCVWTEFYSGDEIMKEYTSYIKFHGAQFDEANTGPNYSCGEAIKLVMAALKEIYAGRHTLSAVRITPECTYESKMNIRQAAEFLLKSNYNRVFVESVINKERALPSLYASYMEIKKDYPDAVRDFSVIH